MSPQINFIVYTPVKTPNLRTSLGMPEYSYYFVLRGFLPLLEDMGRIFFVENPDQEVDSIYDNCRKRGEKCVFLSFAPPNKSATGLRCPTTCVLAWEFDRIPDEVWDDDPRNDWRYVFQSHGRAITLSSYSTAAVKKAMGEAFCVATIPVPVWDRFADFRNRSSGHSISGSTEIAFGGSIIDSRDYSIGPESFELMKPWKNIQFKNWIGEPLKLQFAQTDDHSAFLCGFYEPEAWGTWSRIEKPWVLIPYVLHGKVKLKIIARGYAYNVNKRISISIGRQTKRRKLKAEFSEIKVTFKLQEPAYIVEFSDLDLTPPASATDPRSMGIGLQSIEISGRPRKQFLDSSYFREDESRKVTLDGVIYTSVLNPADDRKNWQEMLTAFTMAFREVEDATLVLKMTHHSLASFLGKLHFLFQRMSPFKCRIVAMHGYMDAEEYDRLIRGTHYYVNTSRCEGLCLPLMEYMTCGKPAITPIHTAMVDYVDSSAAFIVRSSLEPGIWPHDPRQVFRALRYRIDWESLVLAFQRSYHMAKEQPDIYNEMAGAAAARIKDFSSNHVVRSAMELFLETIENG